MLLSTGNPACDSSSLSILTVVCHNIESIAKVLNALNATFDDGGRFLIAIDVAVQCIGWCAALEALVYGTILTETTRTMH